MNIYGIRTLLLSTVLLLLVWSAEAFACPFCNAPAQTLSEEIAAADVGVIARLVSLPPEADLGGGDSVSFDLDNPDSGAATFEVIETIRGGDFTSIELPEKGSTIKAVYFGGDEQKKRFLISGIAGKTIDWSTPRPLTKRGVKYIKTLPTLPEKGAERVAFFLGHLEDPDPLLAQDAYDEFARAPYETITAIGDRIDRAKLLGWIEDPLVGPTRRRLYLTMLGVCGQPEDVAVLESLINYDYQQIKPGVGVMLAMMGQCGPVVGTPILDEMIKADVRRKQQCLDALIAAYIKLKGPAGLPLIEKRFLANPAADYTHVYATIMALRFHGEETDSLPRERLLQSVRLLLDNEGIVDQVIPDLARWEDWSVLERLVTMFKNADENAWLRQPVIAYLIAATEQSSEVSERANLALTELEELDPEGVKRARSYMSFGLLARVGSKDQPEEKEGVNKAVADEESVKDVDADAKIAPQEPVETFPPQELTEESHQDVLAMSSQVESKVVSEEATPAASPSRVLLIGGPLLAGLVLFGLFALLLRGTSVRSSNSGL